jgi:hypothetical protein
MILCLDGEVVWRFSHFFRSGFREAAPFSASLSLLAASRFPPAVKSRADEAAPCGQRRSGEEIDDIVIPQVDRGEDEGADHRTKEIEEPPGVTIG